MTRARLLTVVQDITVGIAVGVTLGSLIFMHRMARMVAVETHETVLEEDQADSSESDDQDRERDPDFIVYRISGPFFLAPQAWSLPRSIT